MRDHLTLEIRPVHSLLSALVVLPWQAAPDNPVLAALQRLKGLYEQGVKELPVSTSIDFGKVWKALYPVPKKPEHVEAWLTPENRSAAELQDLLSDRAVSTYEHAALQAA